MRLPAVRGLLRGKTACITGGTTGIGRAIALEYLRQGANVAVNHLDLPRDEELKTSMLQAAKKLKQEDKDAGSLIEVAGDITRPETGKGLVEAAVGEFGQLDILVSNAGIFTPSAFLEFVPLSAKTCRPQYGKLRGLC